MSSISKLIKNKKLLFLILPIIVLILFSFIFIISSQTKVTIDQLTWDNPPILISVNNTLRETQEGLLFLRLYDGKEQFFPGNWKTFYTNQGAYVYGSYNDLNSNQTFQGLYFISNKQLRQINLAGFNGTITNIQNSITNSYTAIEIDSEKGTIYCIAKNILGEAPNCQQLSINKKTTITWHPEEDNILILKTPQNQIYKYDANIDKMDAIVYDEEPETFNTLNSLYNNESFHKIYSLFNIHLIKSSTGYYLQRTPLYAKIESIDQNHLLIKTNKNLLIRELSSNQESLLLSKDNLNGSTIFPFEL